MQLSGALIWRMTADVRSFWKIKWDDPWESDVACLREECNGDSCAYDTGGGGKEWEKDRKDGGR